MCEENSCADQLRGLPEWPRWLNGPGGYMAKIGTTKVAQIATWPRW